MTERFVSQGHVPNNQIDDDGGDQNSDNVSSNNS